MDDTNFLKDQQQPNFKDECQHLLNMSLPEILLPNQDGNLLNICRKDTFRLVIYFYSMTGNPNKKLPKNWNQIPGATGCTLENCLFRDNYDNFIKLNTIPIGISTQKVDEIKEMTLRLKIPFDILSDQELICVNKLFLPSFSLDNKSYFKRLTIIVENNTIKQTFYPIKSINKHVDSVLRWLKKN